MAERELPIQLVEYEALYEPVNSPSTVPAGRVRAQVRSHDEVSLQEHYQAHHHTRCEQTFDAQCRPGPLLVHVPELAPRPDVAPAPERTCASLLEGAESSLPAGESTLPEELSFPEDSTTPDAASAPALEQIAARLRAEPTIECLAVVAQATPNERPGIAELRAAAIRRQLIERGIAPSRLHAVALTTNVLGPGRPDERPPSERRVRFRVLLQQGR